MPFCGILCTAMFRFERERVLHCCLYRGRQAHIPPFPSIGDGKCIYRGCLYRGRQAHIPPFPSIGDGDRISNQRFLRYDGSTPGPFPLICPTQRILNSCYALIKYRRVQTSLRRIIIRSASCYLSSLNELMLLLLMLLYALLF